jgi:hypothetical protein
MVAAVPETAGHSRHKSAAVRENDATSASIANATDGGGWPVWPGTFDKAKTFARSSAS